ncbi:SET domain-containing protein-lysine N-methyltransferase [Criblamydia sequanensis]|uniref:SET domain-containing protein n=1 Tax=Candidatus Criblamydia sequanensis CRIB-18 TaxID=1437425 RepID=A0A090CZL5_9BACT|nr:SET domain-containing protein-lysine N-methyltransferase [Criblamydia sequanensis]CDR34577.1 SET domain-containing protein [Criblamydia sequanensis CRIB-18]
MLKENYFPEPLPYDPEFKKAREIKIAFKWDKLARRVRVKEFEKLTHVNYIDHLAFPSRKFCYELINEIKKGFDEGEIDKQAEWFGFQYRNELLQGKVADVSIRFIHDRIGFGVFADSPLKPGEFIGEYVGMILKVSRYFSSYINPYCFRYPLNKKLFNYTIDAESFANEVSFINHSKSPNAESIITLNHHLLHIVIRAIRPIETGEEITFDYGNDFLDDSLR